MTAPEAVSGVETAKIRQFSFLGPLLAPSEPRGWPRRVVWHPKHFHTVYLGATHPYHALGPLNRPLRHSWGPQKGSFRARMALLGAPKVLGGPRGARFGPDCLQLARLGWTHGDPTF